MNTITEINVISLLSEVKQNGGVTFDLNNKRPSEGYLVALEYHEKVIENVDTFTTEHLVDFINENSDLVGRINDLYFGVWVDTETNKVYLDVAENIQDQRTAIRKGIAAKQISIFDLNTKTVLFL